MRMTELFGLTLRESPADAQTCHHQLLVRAAFISLHQPGRFTFLPLGERFAGRLSAQAMAAFSALSPQAIYPPRDLDLTTLLTDLCARHVRSHKHLPRCLWHITLDTQSEAKASLGLFQTIATNQIQTYDLSGDEKRASFRFEQISACTRNLLERCQTPFLEADALLTVDWGKRVQPFPGRAFYYQTGFGEDTLFLCPDCGYCAHKNVALFRKQSPSADPPRAIEKVATPECKTIAALARYLAIPEEKTAKAVFLIASRLKDHDLAGWPEEFFVFVILRGDMELNESKLERLLGADALRPASDAEIRAAGAVPGYASPVGLHPPATGALPTVVVVDDIIPISPNLVGGANDEGYHFINLNYGRDFTAQIVADIAACRLDYPCPRCGESLQAIDAVEIARAGLLGSQFAEENHCLVQNENEEYVPIVISIVEIDLERLMASIVEANHDEAGMILPARLAPFDIHLVYLLDKKDDQPMSEAERLYEGMRNAGWEVLFDDRDERPGVKFNDADLIGIPLRITVSTRSLAGGGVEFKPRSEVEREIIPLEEVIPRLRAILH
jgi:prolyl-tRNA synthetase